MHVLVTEAHFGGSDRLIQRLRALGVRVTGCHDKVGYCRVLQSGGSCPLDASTDRVDLVVDVRGAGEELTAREYGAVCAVRDRRPVLIVGVDPDVPVVIPAGLRGHAIATTEEELVTMCLRRDQTLAAARLGWPGRPPTGADLR
jgi:hypothetical protein